MEELKKHGPEHEMTGFSQDKCPFSKCMAAPLKHAAACLKRVALCLEVVFQNTGGREFKRCSHASRHVAASLATSLNFEKS